MSIFTTILATIVALEHLFIFYLETIATQSEKTGKTFNMSQEELSRKSVSTLLKNQGIYNALLALFLLYGIITGNLEITTIFVLFVIGAAGYGAATSSPSILLKQGGPAILALLSILLFR
ncbi:TPA: DUF1304 domain-containing protein [Streptococcus suis]|nr:DUF1304 domain-containing protein [Streptococcus suis]